MALVGRAHELDVLGRGLEGAVAGRGSLHLLSGEPGIGKTRLADEVAGRAAAMGMTVVWGRAWESGGAPPFYPWIEILEALGGKVAGAPVLDPTSASRGDRASADPMRERFALFSVVLGFLRSCARRQPVLAIFDDLHAADVPSLELLHFLSRGLRAAPIAVIGTLRDVEARRPHVADVLARIGRESQQLSLKALTAEDVALLVAEHTGRDDTGLASRVLAMSEGNPLFVQEVLRTLTDRREWDVSVSLAPATGVYAVIESRVADIDPRAASLLESAAVLGREVRVAALAGVTGMPHGDVILGLEGLVARGLLRESRASSSYAFSHALVREAFYERVPPERRRELHRAIATTLAVEGPSDPALVAHHLLAALPLVSAGDVVRAAISAADAARSRLAYEDAAAMLERTSAALEGLFARESDRIELLVALGWAATESGALARGRQVFREATARARTSGDAILLARAALGQGGEYVFGEVRAELVATLQEALDALGTTSLPLRALLLGRLAAALQPSDTPEQPVAIAREAILLAKDIADPRVRAQVAVAAGSAFTDFAPPDTRVPVNEDLVRTARELGDAVLELRGLTRLATDWMELGDFTQAEIVIDARAELAARSGHPRYMWQTPLLRSMLAMPKGDFSVCDEALEEARAIAQEAADPNAAHVIAMHQLWMLLVRGDTEGLRAHRPEALRAMGRMPEPAQHHALVHAVVHARCGDHEAARAALALLGDASSLQAPMMTATIAGTALLAGAQERYSTLLAKLSGLRGRNTLWGPFGFVCGPPYDVVVGSLYAALGRIDEARGAFATALTLARASRAHASEAWARLAMGEAMRSWSDPAASEHLGIAARLALTHGMPEITRRAEAAGAGAAPASVPPMGTAALPVEPAFSLRAEDKQFVLVCNGRTTKLKAVRGLPMLARLIASEGHEVHVLDLSAAPEDPDAVADMGDAGEVLDPKARAAYRQRIADLREEVDEADGFADIGRADRARRELDMLVQQLAGAVGLGGRERRAGSVAERARITVQRRVREAIKKIAEHEPALARHLDWAIRTGTFCAYEPRGRNTAG